MSLIPIDHMPKVDGFDVPRELYVVWRDGQALLAGMRDPSYQSPSRWEALSKCGLHTVVCLLGHPTYDASPLSVVPYPLELQDQYGHRPPDNPAVEERRYRAAVQIVIDNLVQKKVGVVVHCVGGTGRTGTVVGCALCALGISADEAIDYMKVLHVRRGRVWPEHPWQEQMVRDYR